LLPSPLISSLANVSGFDEASFTEAHAQAAPPISIRLNPAKWNKVKSQFLLTDKVSWSQTGYYLPKRPVFTLDPLLHAGAYYVQEASSMFLEQAIQKILSERDIRYALDLCAAPGGKSTHLLGLLPDSSVLVSNEVISNRVFILQENITKWGHANTIITQNDPESFGALGPLFDLMVVDAPCSGSGLFRRDAAAMEEWSPQAVELCSQRQQRILADALPCLQPGGYLLYATCSYSFVEDEAILDWLSANFELRGIALDWTDGKDGVVACQSPEAGVPCYRFFPGKVRGEGFFMALLQKKGEPVPVFSTKQQKNRKVPDPIPNLLLPWILQEFQPVFYRHKENGYLMPEAVYKLFGELGPRLNIRKAGVKIAEEAHGKYNPVHDFAVSHYINPAHFSVLPLPTPEAIAFLRKEDIALPADTPKGWILVSSHGLPLGWLKNLGNRSNNYYPKEWRIRMQA
jgi:16S rRNA C967 or C1407 C5-methylase (RsmB/RsmF family)/NOL1/NOP2/fmu family ribosome biogenesis protein